VDIVRHLEKYWFSIVELPRHYGDLGRG
jgi:hypothetical protein